jgi:hypothetical protein
MEKGIKMDTLNRGNNSSLGNYSPPVAMAPGLEGMDPEALSFRAVLPAKYQFLVTSYRTRQDQLDIKDSGSPEKRESEFFSDTMLSSIQRQQ